MQKNYDPAVNNGRKEQEKFKPEIDTLIPYYLKGEMEKNAFNLVAYLRESGLPLKWYGRNAWKAKCKGKPICSIFICFPGDVAYFGRPGSSPFWIVSLTLEHVNEYEELIIDEGLQSIFWDNVFYCVWSPKSGKTGEKRGCASGKACAGGRNVLLIGKEIKGLCRWRPLTPGIWDPDKMTIDIIRKLLNWEQQARSKV